MVELLAVLLGGVQGDLDLLDHAPLADQVGERSRGHVTEVEIVGHGVEPSGWSNDPVVTSRRFLVQAKQPANRLLAAA